MQCILKMVHEGYFVSSFLSPHLHPRTHLSSYNYRPLNPTALISMNLRPNERFRSTSSRDNYKRLNGLYHIAREMTRIYNGKELEQMVSFAAGTFQNDRCQKWSFLKWLLMRKWVSFTPVIFEGPVNYINFDSHYNRSKDKDYKVEMKHGY